MATMLRLEKYGRIDFALRRWTPMVQKAPKSMRAHARESFKLARTFFRSLTWLQESLFWRWSCVYRRMYWFGTFGFVSQWNHICQHQHFPHLSLTTAALHSVVRQYAWRIIVQTNVILIQFCHCCRIFYPYSVYSPLCGQFCRNFIQNVASW